MQHPMREMIHLDNPEHATIQDQHSAILFVSGAWSGKRLLLHAAAGVSWSEVRTRAGSAPRLGESWDLTGLLEPGGWQELLVRGGPIAGAMLEAADPLSIDRLEAWYDPPETLSIRCRLSKSPAGAGREGLFALLFTLTDERGRQVGRQEVFVGARTAELAVAMELAREPQGRCALKASLCLDQQVIDDARIEVLDFA